MNMFTEGPSDSFDAPELQPILEQLPADVVGIIVVHETPDGYALNSSVRLRRPVAFALPELLRAYAATWERDVSTPRASQS